MAVWICLNFTKPSPPTKSSVRVSIRTIRLAMSVSSSSYLIEKRVAESTSADVQQHAAVDAVAVARLLAEERRRVVLRLDRREPVITTQSPAPRVPVHAAADVAREEGVRADDAERRLLEETQSTDTAGDERRPEIGRAHV